MTISIKTLGVALLILLLSGCATMSRGAKTPDFYPNETYTRNPHEAQMASQQCMSLASQYIQEANRWQDAAKKGAVGAAVGAGTGAVGGTIMKAKVGRSTAAGAAVGGIIGVLSSLNDTNEHSPSYERFVERCLQNKGYEVLGWSPK